MALQRKENTVSCQDCGRSWHFMEGLKAGDVCPSDDCSSNRNKSEPCVGVVGFYRPDPGHKKSPNVVFGISGSKLMVLEVPTQMVFEIDRDEWMSLNDMRERIFDVISGPRYNGGTMSEFKEDILKGYVDAMVAAVRIAQELPNTIALHIVRTDAELESVRNMTAGTVVTNGTEFDGTFDDAVEGLLEYHPDLGDKELVKNIKEIVRDIYQGTGNTQSDYERVRDAVESEIKRVERTDKLRQ